MINIVKNHVPITSKKRTRIPMKPIYITVHSTANPNSTAKNERAWLTNPSNTSSTGFHYVVDDKEAIEVIPPREVAWHAGDGNGPGNRSSIGVEICESGNREKTMQNAIVLIQHLMKTHQIDKIRRHHDWSGKNCPRILSDDGKWTKWNIFYNKLMKEGHTVEKLRLSLNGKIKEVDTVTINGNNFIKLRDLADHKIVVDYDSAKKLPIVTIRVE